MAGFTVYCKTIIYWHLVTSTKSIKFEIDAILVMQNCPLCRDTLHLLS